MSSVFSIPGKTFLAGEYLALDGGAALLAMTSPRFELFIQDGSGCTTGIPAGSPAAQFILREKHFFANYDLEFRDPYLGAGGWGASTAQYLGVYAARETQGGLNEGLTHELEASRLLHQYQQDAWDGQGRAPSGADLIGQFKGDFTFFEKRSGLIARHAWPFAGLDGYLLRTGVKLATHEHLRTLAELKTERFAALMLQIREAWSEASDDKFADGIKEYGRELQAQKLVATTTLSLLHDLLWMDGVTAAKGCGAMGADVVFVLVKKESRRSFKNWCEQQGLNPIGLQDQLTGGLSLRHESSSQPGMDALHG